MANSPQFVSNRIDVPDSLDEIDELFYRRGWTDGLPIVPPTEERVAQMLSGTSRNPQIFSVPCHQGGARLLSRRLQLTP